MINSDPFEFQKILVHDETVPDSYISVQMLCSLIVK